MMKKSTGTDSDHQIDGLRLRHLHVLWPITTSLHPLIPASGKNSRCGNSVLNSKQPGRVAGEDFRFVLRLDRCCSNEFDTFDI
jgi:hypothetical protein